MSILDPSGCRQEPFAFQIEGAPYPPESSALWTRPRRNLGRLSLESYALTFDGYEFAKAIGIDLIRWGDEAYQRYMRDRKSLASFVDLRCFQFWMQRRARWTLAEGEDFEQLLVNQSVCEAWDATCGKADISVRYQDELQVAVAAAQEAAGFSRAKFHGGKASEIDLPADKMIRDRLLQFFPRYGYRSEELGHVCDPSDADKHLWLVDPQDGTSAAKRGFRSAAVSIALLRAGTPILGVVLAYAAPDSAGDLFFWAEGMKSVHRNDSATQRTWPEALGSSHIALMSQDADNASRGNAEILAPMRFINVPGIAYRLALLAAGEGDLAVSLNNPVGHDLAGGHALLLAAGGDVFDGRGERITYTTSGRMNGSTASGCFAGVERTVRPYLGANWRSLYNQPKTFELSRLLPGRVIEDPLLLSRAQGCLLGQMAGDSLGALVEFSSAKQIAAKFPDGGPKTLRDGGHWNLLAGQPTDDSELALAMARSIVARERYDKEDVIAAYCDWRQSGPFDIGGTISKALNAAIVLRQAGKPPAAATDLKSEANGALMRLSPLGIFGHAMPVNNVWELAITDAQLTHPNPICQQVNGLFASTLGFAIQQRRSAREVFDFCAQLAADRKVAQRIKDFLLRAQSGEDLERADGGKEGWVLIAFQNAFYQLLHADSLESGVVNTARRGGDTDTNAAITGALLGAVYGREAVPMQWVSSILCCRPLAGLPGVYHPRPAIYWPVDTLVLAERLLVAGRLHSVGD